MLRDMLADRRAELPARIEPALAAMILGAAATAAVHTALFERPECLSDGSLERELTALCRAYLGVA
jgi:hypothetical protein